MGSVGGAVAHLFHSLVHGCLSFQLDVRFWTFPPQRCVFCFLVGWFFFAMLRRHVTSVSVTVEKKEHV